MDGSDSEDLRRQLREVQRQAEEYKNQLKRKEQEAEVYKKQLTQITISKLSWNLTIRSPIQNFIPSRRLVDPSRQSDFINRFVGKTVALCSLRLFCAACAKDMCCSVEKNSWNRRHLELILCQKNCMTVNCEFEQPTYHHHHHQRLTSVAPTSHKREM